MKRILLFVVFIVLLFVAVAQEVTVRFAGQLNDTLRCDIDSVVVSNATRQWTVATTDTFIVLTPTVDIRQMVAVANMLGQNVPNPFDCKTAVELSMSQSESVRLQLVDAGDTTAVVCDSFNWYEHTNITESGDFAHTFTAANGCDSVVTLHLTINHCTGQLQNHTWVDLGLSVKWASTNVGATNTEDAGDYFAWGETMPKTSYAEDNYTYRDNPATLPARADAAIVIWGNGWRMPTSAKLQELKDNCVWEWTTQNNVNGYLVT